MLVHKPRIDKFAEGAASPHRAHGVTEVMMNARSASAARSDNASKWRRMGDAQDPRMQDGRRPRRPSEREREKRRGRAGAPNEPHSHVVRTGPPAIPKPARMGRRSTRSGGGGLRAALRKRDFAAFDDIRSKERASVDPMLGVVQNAPGFSLIPAADLLRRTQRRRKYLEAEAVRAAASDPVDAEPTRQDSPPGHSPGSAESSKSGGSVIDDASASPVATGEAAKKRRAAAKPKAGTGAIDKALSQAFVKAVDEQDVVEVVVNIDCVGFSGSRLRIQYRKDVLQPSGRRRQPRVVSDPLRFELPIEQRRSFLAYLRDEGFRKSTHNKDFSIVRMPNSVHEHKLSSSLMRDAAPAPVHSHIPRTCNHCQQRLAPQEEVFQCLLPACRKGRKERDKLQWGSHAFEKALVKRYVDSGVVRAEAEALARADTVAEFKQRADALGGASGDVDDPQPFEVCRKCAERAGTALDQTEHLVFHPLQPTKFEQLEAANRRLYLAAAHNAAASGSRPGAPKPGPRTIVHDLRNLRQDQDRKPLLLLPDRFAEEERRKEAEAEERRRRQLSDVISSRDGDHVPRLARLSQSAPAASFDRLVKSHVATAADFQRERAAAALSKSVLPSLPFGASKKAREERAKEEEMAREAKRREGRRRDAAPRVKGLKAAQSVPKLEAAMLAQMAAGGRSVVQRRMWERQSADLPESLQPVGPGGVRYSAAVHHGEAETEALLRRSRITHVLRANGLQRD